MSTTLKIILSSAAALDYIFSMWRLTHMFQLNSYKPGVQLKWYREHFVKIIPILSAIPVKAKKKLAVTARVKRLFATLGILLLAAAAADAFMSVYICMTGIAAVLSPLVLLLGNLINRPIEKGIAQYYLNDAKKILAGCKDMPIIGITGSYGKTSVKYYLGTLMKAKYNVLVTPESFNTPMGVTRTVREHMKSTHNMFICEMGARNVGDIRELCDMVHPVSGVITAIGEQHLESFGRIENTVSTKFELEQSLPEDGVLFVNGDNEYIRERIASDKLKKGRRVITYGLSKERDYYADEIVTGVLGTTFTVHAPGGQKQEFRTKLIGEHNVQNIVGAICVANSYGISLEELVSEVRKLESVPHRMELIRRNQITIIDDAYNANPAGAKAALNTLSMIDGYRIIVTPGMVELGDRAQELNHELGLQASKSCDMVIAVGKLNGDYIYSGALDGGMSGQSVFKVDTLGQAMQIAYATVTDKPKVILLENDLTDNY